MLRTCLNICLHVDVIYCEPVQLRQMNVFVFMGSLHYLGPQVSDIPAMAKVDRTESIGLTIGI